MQAQSDDVFINDAPIATRDQLTRRAALAYVEQQTGTSIVIKGRFYPPGAPRDSVNPPIHLHITPQPYLGTVSATAARVTCTGVLKERYELSLKGLDSAGQAEQA